MFFVIAIVIVGIRHHGFLHNRHRHFRTPFFRRLHGRDRCNIRHCMWRRASALSARPQSTILVAIALASVSGQRRRSLIVLYQQFAP